MSRQWNGVGYSSAQAANAARQKNFDNAAAMQPRANTTGTADAQDVFWKIAVPVMIVMGFFIYGVYEVAQDSKSDQIAGGCILGALGMIGLGICCFQISKSKHKEISRQPLLSQQANASDVAPQRIAPHVTLIREVRGQEAGSDTNNNVASPNTLPHPLTI